MLILIFYTTLLTLMPSQVIPVGLGEENLGDDMANLAASINSPLDHQPPGWNVLGLAIALFITILGLELITSADYVFSYLYIGPILLTSFRLSRRTTLTITFLAVMLTLGNMWIPGSDRFSIPTLENRLIAVIALIVTWGLSDRNRHYQDTIAQQALLLQWQTKLASLREDFVATLTHDLKTPLLGAIETLSVFQTERYGNITPQQNTILDAIIRSHRASVHLVQTVLDIYRNDLEGVALSWAPINLTQLVQEVINGLRDLAENYQVTLNLHCEVDADNSQENLGVHGDALQLQRVVSNLVINAINHSPMGGHVEVVVTDRLDLPHSHLSVEVLDEGPGIGDEELPQLFERFYQGRSQRQAKGSGLGLYLSRQIVEAHSGTIWATNRHPRGAVFGFSLPM